MVHYVVPIPIGTELASTGIEWKGLRSRFPQKNKTGWINPSLVVLKITTFRE